MATCPSCINATLDYLCEEDVELPDLGTWEKMVRKKVDVYRCPACSHVERVLRDPPKIKQPLGPISSKQIISGILILAFVVFTLADIYSPSVWSILCSGAVFIILIGWLALTSVWGLFTTLRTKLIAAKGRRVREKNNKDIRRTPTLPMPAAGRTPESSLHVSPAPLLTRFSSVGEPSASSQEPRQAGLTLTVGEGVSLDLNSGQLEWEERRTAKTCPNCKSSKLIDMLEEDSISSGDIKERIDPTLARFYRCPSCHYVVREGPRALSKTTQLRLVKVGVAVGLLVSLIEKFVPDAASFAIYAIVMAVSLLLAYIRGDSE